MVEKVVNCTRAVAKEVSESCVPFNTHVFIRSRGHLYTLGTKAPYEQTAALIRNNTGEMERFLSESEKLLLFPSLSNKIEK